MVSFEKGLEILHAQSEKRSSLLPNDWTLRRFMKYAWLVYNRLIGASKIFLPPDSYPRLLSIRKKNQTQNTKNTGPLRAGDNGAKTFIKSNVSLNNKIYTKLLNFQFVVWTNQA